MQPDPTPTEGPNVPSDEFRVYTLSLNHFATGEGVLVQILVTGARDETEARELFRAAFYPGRALPRSFWPTVHRGIPRERLRMWCSEALIDRLESLETVAGGVSFFLNWSLNTE